jgi:hypothetical protein
MKTSTVLPSGRDTHYGFGLQIGEWEGRARVEHGGGIFGFNSKLSWIPGDDLHVAVISNGERISSDKLAEAIAYVVLDVERAAVKDDPIPADVITKLSGDYVFDVIGLEAKVFESGEQLMVQGNGQSAFRVLWQGGLEFRAEFDTEVRFVFAADGKSVQLHQNGRMVDGVRK